MAAFDAAAVVAQRVPVLCIDTCSLLDIMRDPTRDDARPHERQAAIELVDRLEGGELACLVADQVTLEFQVHDAEIQEEAKNALRKLRERVERANGIHALFLPAVSVKLDHLEGQVVEARGLIERWRGAAAASPGSDGVFVRAINRVNRNIAPARQGKDSVKDCIVFETYLSAIQDLRDGGMASAAVFLSSNVKEYLTDSRVVKSDIMSDLARLNIAYTPNMAAAKRFLGF